LDAWTIASMVSGEPLPCSPEVEEELLRIAQEASSNANRHAQAKEIRIAPLIQRDSA
jgi:signal transduction histidine kinase